MKQKKKCLKRMFAFSFLFCIVISIKAQQIKGIAIGEDGKTIPRANILIKTNKNVSSISEFVLADDLGNLDFVLKKTYSSTIYLETSALNYDKKLDSIVNPDPEKIYTFDFVLYPKITQLEEVIISERKKFNIKKDTVVFNPEAYKDGTERKVEDILKKIPGIEVAESGRIKYRGKEVSAVQLDGDDLFGSKYTIGTKNIAVDMVDQIEAIENFSKNPLLKGIENSDRVALNLKLKKNKTDYSGTTDFGFGYGDKSYADISTTLIGVSSRFKSFGVVSFNNTGNYPASDRENGGILAFDTENESTVFSKKIINTSAVSNVLGNSRSRVDERWYGSYNALYKFSKKAKVKANIVYLKDKVFQEEQFQNSFFTTTDKFGYTDVSRINQNSQAKGVDLEFTWNTSKKSLLEIQSSISKISERSNNSFIRNRENPFVNKSTLEDFLLKNKLLFTYKLNKNTALQYTSLYSTNSAPQDFDTFGNFFSVENALDSYFQFSEYKKETYQNRLLLLGRKNEVKYTWTNGVDYSKNPYDSYLKKKDSLRSDFQNSSHYDKIDYFSVFSTAFNKGKLKIEPIVSLSYVVQKIKDNLYRIPKQQKEYLVLEPSLRLGYKINGVSNLGFRGNYEQKSPEEEYLFYNNVIIDNRNVRNNEVSLNLLQRQNYSISYSLHDLYHNIDASVAIGYTNTKNMYLSDVVVNENFTSVTYFQSPVDLDSWFYNASLERYLRFMQTTLKIGSLYSVSDFKNVINQSDFRDGKTERYEGTLFAKTAFRIPVNFQSLLTYTITSFSISDQSLNKNYAIKNSFKTIIRPNKKWLFTFTYDFFKPDTKSNQDFSFLDFSIEYKPKNVKWISGRFIGKNLLDNRVFEQVQNSDFSTTVYQSNLIPRYFMVSLDMNF